MSDAHAASDLDEYVRNVLGDDGILAVSFGIDPYRDDNGTYRHRQFKNRYYQLPTGLDKLRRDVEATSGKRVDVYVCPAVRSTRSRLKGSAKQPLTLLWTDLDGSTNDDLLAKLNPFTVESGTPEHLHAYIRLSEAVSLDDWQLLQTALRTRLNGDAKIADNDLLRLPGTWNHKTDPPNPVRCLTRPGKAWNPEDLAAALLDVGQDAPPPPEQITPEQPPYPLPAVVRGVLDDRDVDDRSKTHHRLIMACKIGELSLGQMLAVVSDYLPSRAKYSDRLADEVARSWGKIEELVTYQPPPPPQRVA